MTTLVRSATLSYFIDVASQCGLDARALATAGRPDEAIRLLEEAPRSDPRMEPVARDMRRRVERGRSVILKF